MKQATKQTKNVKQATHKTPATPKTNKVDESMLHLQKKSQFNRFLEASCDCV